MNRTSIEWTHRPGTAGMTWNPIRARRKDGKSAVGRSGTFCTKISPGCKNCYASTINRRFGTGLEFEVPNLAEHEFFLDERILAEPLKRKDPATIFVGDMFDLFHEAIPTELIVRVLEVAGRKHGHTMQILTKRSERMAAIVHDIGCFGGDPPPWIWFGVSVESQKYADERIPVLLRMPASVRFVSAEPLLDAIKLDHHWFPSRIGRPVFSKRDSGFHDGPGGGLHWVIVGGESGPSARRFDINWAKSLEEQCRAAGVAFFMKQLGSNPGYMTNGGEWAGWTNDGSSRKGGDPEDWPDWLRVREFPRSVTAA